MKKVNVKSLTRAGILLALVIVVQLIGTIIPAPANSFVVGPLVNACILVATVALGIWGGVAISVIAPFSSLLFNHAGISLVLLPFTPFIAIGNILFAIVFFILYKKSNIVAVGAGSVLKFAFLWSAIILFLNISNITGVVAKTFSFLFSWPQLITAVVGGAVALLVIKALGKTIDE
ncbi:MAG: ECF transporter S component [Clostridia bacterium]|jgi:hypothetical protein